MRVGIYPRVSTHDQQTLPMQLEKMKEYIINRGWTLAAEVEEIGSGATSSASALKPESPARAKRKGARATANRIAEKRRGKKTL